MASDSNEFSNILINGVDFKNRRIYFGMPVDGSEEDTGDFSQATVEIAVRALHRMAVDAPGRTIEIHMNSWGGEPYSMLRLHDEILACPCQIRFIGGGAVMSCATWIMVSCDERHLHPNTSVMVHDGGDVIEGKHTDVLIGAAEAKRLQDVLYDIYAANTRMPREFWEDLCQRDLFITATEAVTLGMADKVVEPRRRGNLRKARQAALKRAPDVGDMRKLINKLYARVNKVKVPRLELNEILKEPADPTLVVDLSKPVDPPVPSPSVPEPEKPTS
jgi:ATP-dependent protease ClpP protease subunit